MDLERARHIKYLVTQLDEWQTFLDQFKTREMVTLYWVPAGQPSKMLNLDASPENLFMFNNVGKHIEVSAQAHIHKLTGELAALLEPNKPETPEGPPEDGQSRSAGHSVQ